MGVSRRAVGIFVLAGCMIAIFSFFLIRFFGPVKFSDADIGGVALLLVAYLPLLAVLLVWFLYSPSPVARIYKFARSPRIPSGSIALPFFWLMSLIYLLVVYFDLIVVRDVFATGVTEARYAAIDQGSRESFYGAISLLMSAAPVVLFGMYLSRHVCGVKVSGEKKALLGLVLILTGLSYVGSGGRNAVALSLVYLFFVYLLSKSVARNHSGFPRKLKVFDSKAVFYFSTLTLVLFSFIVYWVFISRAELQYGSIENALAAFMESYNVSMRYSLDMGGLFENAEYFVFMLAWYIAHPLGFLGEQIDNMACVPAYGAATFFGFFRIVDFLFSSSFSSGCHRHYIQRGPTCLCLVPCMLTFVGLELFSGI